MIFFYRYFLAPFCIFLLKTFRKILPQKWQSIILLKNELNPKSFGPYAQKPIWIHASSGEVEYAKPLIRLLAEKYPQIPIHLTYSSPSQIPLVKNLPGISSHCILPWDTPQDIKLFLDQLQPRALCIARTDLWPELLYQTKARQIPSILFSATINSSTNQWKKWCLKQLSQIFCIHKHDVEQGLQWKLPVHEKIVGDTRIDQVLFRLQNPKILPESKKPKLSAWTLVAGSTWPEDEEVLYRLLKLCPSLKMIIVPHEVQPKHIADIEKNLHKHKIAFSKWSQTESWENSQVLLVDQVGMLAEIYQWGQVAFVGGSFRSRVHSVMEPLAQKLPVIVGPYYTNSPEAVQFSKVQFQIKGLHQPPQPLVQRVLNAQQMAQAVQAWMKLSEKDQEDLQRLLDSEMKKRRGTTVAILDSIQDFLRISSLNSTQNPVDPAAFEQ